MMKSDQAYTITRLKGGPAVVTHHMPGRQSVSVGIWIGVGGRYESAAEKGISHFLEHLVFKGSRKYSNNKIKELIEGVGGSLNAFTSEEFTCYLTKIPARYRDTALDVLSDMACHPLLKATDVDKERTVIIEEIKMYKDLPQQYVHELLDELLWPGHPLGMSIAGTIESVGAIRRNDVFEFQKKCYAPSNIAVVACGDVDHKHLCKKVASMYERLPGGRPVSYKAAAAPVRKVFLHAYQKETEQTHLSLGMHALKREHPDRYALSVLNTILGANMSSRLFNEVREKRGLAYEIASHTKRFYDAGAFLINAGVDNSKVLEALRVILGELHKISSEPVKDRELRCAKEYLTGQISIAFEDTMEHMLWLGEQIKATNKIISLDEVIAGISKVTKDDILRLAGKIFKKDNIYLALIGPNADNDKEIIEKLFGQIQKR